MKKIKNILILALAATAVVACTDLDTYPEGSTVTEDQKNDQSKYDPNVVAADVNGVFSSINKCGLVNEDYHFDFGYPGFAMMMDACGQDIVAEDVGYNWFSSELMFSDRVYTSVPDFFIWKLFYSQIMAANSVIKLVDKDATDNKMRFYRAQALAVRAFDYMNLAQVYQFSYDKYKTRLCVPILTELTTADQAAQNPRATVEAVYTQILSDLKEAKALLVAAESGADGGVRVKRTDKRYVSLSVVNGLLARAYLLTQNYDEAVKCADEVFADSGIAPYSITEVSEPAFNNPDSKSWMWAVIVAETDRVVTSGIVNFPSHMCSVNGSGYAVQTGTLRRINKQLWAGIPETDVRKGWWLDKESYSPLIDGVVNGDGESIVAANSLTPYANVKFGAYKSEFFNTLNATSFPLMRAEEIYMIKAEAQALGSAGVGAAKQTLSDFVRSYRDPSYSFPASATVVDEIWRQRRVELWGEGHSFFDLMRLHKPIDRRSGGFAAAATFLIQADADIMIYRIPEAEISANKGIPESDNNPAAPSPSPVS